MNFDEIIDRTDSDVASSLKWQNYGKKYPGYDVSNTIPMWVADMDFRVADEILDAMEKRLKHGIFGYASQDDVHRFAACCSGWLQRRHSLTVNPDHMLFSPGVLCGLNAAIQEFTQPGDGIIIPDPVYHPFADGTKNNGRVVKYTRLVEKNGVYNFNFDEIEKLAQDPKTTMMIISNPHNPGGRIWNLEELTQLADICQRNQVLLFSDEIHSDLILPGNKHVPTLAVDAKYHHNIISAYAPSKTFNLAALCAALVVVPDDAYRRRMWDRFMMNRSPRANVFGLTAGKAAYTHGDRYVDELVVYLDKNIRYFTAEAEKIHGVKVMHPQGTYLLWIDFTGTGLDEHEIYRRVLEDAGIAGDLGANFGPSGKNHVRFNLACPMVYVEKAAAGLKKAFGVNE